MLTKPIAKILPLTLALSILLASLMACKAKNSPSAILDNYLYRLSNSLKLPQPDVLSASPLPAFPSRRELLRPIESSSINLIEFLKLSTCELQRHIGQRNSSLGSFMKGSQQLLYEYRFIELAEVCLRTLDTAEPLAQKLAQVLQLKQQQLPLVRWNSVFASEEMITLFSLGATPLSSSAIALKPVELITALNDINTFLTENTLTEAQVENAYSVLASSKRMGELRLSMRLLRDYLTVADTLLTTRIHEKPLCFKQQPSAQFQVVEAVFLKFYIGEVQPYIAQLHQQAQLLFTEFNHLLEASSLPQPDSFLTFWEEVYVGDDSEWQRFDQAIKTHTQYWQGLLKQCGKLPN